MAQGRNLFASLVLKWKGDAGAQKAQKAMNQVQQTANRATQSHVKTTLAAQNVVRVVQDLPFGMMGITNNLQSLADSFVYLKNQTGSFTTAITKTMKSLLRGPMAFSLLVAVVTSLILRFDELQGMVQKGARAFGFMTTEMMDFSKAATKGVEAVTKSMLDGRGIVEVQRFGDTMADVVSEKRMQKYQEMASIIGSQLNPAMAVLLSMPIGQSGAATLQGLLDKMGLSLEFLTKEQVESIKEFKRWDKVLESVLEKNAEMEAFEKTLRRFRSEGFDVPTDPFLEFDLTETIQSTPSTSQFRSTVAKFSDRTIATLKHDLSLQGRKIDLGNLLFAREDDESFDRWLTLRRNELDRFIAEKNRAVREGEMSSLEAQQRIQAQTRLFEAEVYEKRVETHRRKQKRITRIQETEYSIRESRLAEHLKTFQLGGEDALLDENNILESFKIRRRMLEEELRHEQQLMEERLELIKSKIDRGEVLSDDELSFYLNYQQKRLNLEQEHNNKIKEDRKDTYDELTETSLDIATKGFANMEQASQGFFNIWKQERERELDQMNLSEEQKTKILEEEGKKRFNIMKAIAIADTLVSTYAAAQQAYYAGAKIHPILGAAFAATATASGLARVQAIRKQRIGGSGGGGSNAGGSGTQSGFTSLNANVVRDRAANFETNTNNRASNGQNQQVDRFTNAVDRFEKAAQNMRVTIDDPTMGEVARQGGDYNTRYNR